jgi:hypothetical protein
VTVAAGDPHILLEQLIQRDSRSYERLAEELEALSWKNDIDGRISAKHLQRLARGERPHTSCKPGTRQLLEMMFRHSFAELFGPPRSDTVASVVAGPYVTEPRRLTAEAATHSLDFLSWAEADRVAPALLEHVQDELRRVAVDYVHAPLLPLFHDLIELRDTTVTLLRDRPHPGQSRELFSVAGVTCLLLAHASQNLGDSSAAMAQARTAWACAEQADHNDLRAWVLGTQALIAEWTDRYPKAIELAQRGQGYASTSESRVRLAAIEARVQARAGNVDAALAAVEAGKRAREAATRQDDLADYGGLLTFPVAKQLYYAGSTLSLAGQAAAAEQTALDAIRMYESGPGDQRSYGDEALARVDVALARIATGDLDGAGDALGPVFALPQTQRIKQVGSGLQRVRSALHGIDRAQMASELRDSIDGFTPPAP